MGDREKEGLISKLDDKDLIHFLIYLTDPSFIMTCLYHCALDEPGEFLPPKEVEVGSSSGGSRSRRGVPAVLLSEVPAWLCGFESTARKAAGRSG